MSIPFSLHQPRLEAGVGPLLEPRGDHGDEQCGHARELGPRELDAEIGGTTRLELATSAVAALRE